MVLMLLSMAVASEWRVGVGVGREVQMAGLLQLAEPSRGVRLDAGRGRSGGLGVLVDVASVPIELSSSGEPLSLHGTLARAGVRYRGTVEIKPLFFGVLLAGGGYDWNVPLSEEGQLDALYATGGQWGSPEAVGAWGSAGFEVMTPLPGQGVDLSVVPELTWLYELGFSRGFRVMVDTTF